MKVKLGLRNLSSEEKIALAKTIRTAMTTNAATFPNANPPMAALGTLITNAEGSVAAYNTGAQTLEALLMARDQALDALCAGMTQEGGYVDSVAAGDPAKIALAGMGVKGNGSPVGPMPRVLELLLSEGDHAGYIDAMWKPIYGARSYEIQTSADPMSETTWGFKMTSTKSSATLAGLASGSKVWVRVRAIGADPLPGDWSDPGMKVVP